MTSSDHALEAAQPVVAATPSPSYISPLLRSLNQSSTRQPSRTARSFAQALNTRELAQSSGYSSSSLNDSNYSSLTHNQYTPADMSSSRSLSQVSYYLPVLCPRARYTCAIGVIAYCFTDITAHSYILSLRKPLSSSLSELIASTPSSNSVGSKRPLQLTNPPMSQSQ